MTGRLAALARFPVKGLGGEALESARLAPGRPLQGDRAYGLAHSGSAAAAVGWARARDFATPRRAPELARVAVSLGAEGRLSAAHPALGAWDGGPDGLCEWLAGLAGPMAPLRLVAGGAGALHDVEAAHLSIGNLASLRAISERAGVPPDPRRFRMNVWLDGFAPWSEVGAGTVEIGAARLRVVAPVERCVAPDANPETGRRDSDLCGELYAAFGHAEFGLYAVVEAGGDVAPGMEAVLA